MALLPQHLKPSSELVYPRARLQRPVVEGEAERAHRSERYKQHLGVRCVQAPVYQLAHRHS